MQLYFIRHGQSLNNLRYVQTGSSDGRIADPALTEVGEQQAELVARFLVNAGDDGVDLDWDPQNIAGFHVTHVYASLMERAVATGHQIAEVLDLPLLTWLDIHETGGMFLYDSETEEHRPQPGRARSYLQTHYPRIVLPDSVTEAGWWNRPFESQEARAPRARRVLRELLERHGDADDRVVFVSHGGFFNHFLHAVLELEGVETLWFGVNNASITRIDFEDGERVVAYMNRVDFLPTTLIT